MKRPFTHALFHIAFTLALSFLTLNLQAKIEGRYFETDKQEALYQTLVQELRCLVCQNQNLADSNAELAQDLREKTYTMVIANQSRSEIVDYMVARYGDFVMYKPPLDARTLILWLGPFVILIAAIAIAVVNLRHRDPDKKESKHQDHQEHKQARHILDNDSKHTHSHNKQEKL